MKISILDQAVTSASRGAAEAIRASIELAQLAESLGYPRYWIAEHHATANRASSSPEVLVAAVAARTTHLRVGSGGMMLPNHFAFHVAEQYRTLEALYPGRIDLGVGQSAGAPGRVARLPLGSQAVPFSDQVDELLAYRDAELLPGRSDPRVVVVPDDVGLPPVYLLGTSSASARLAAERGLALAVSAAFRELADVAEVLRSYRAGFTARRPGDSPYAIVCTNVWVGEDERHAWELAAPWRVAIARHKLGEAVPLLPFKGSERLEPDVRRTFETLDTRGDIVGPAEAVARQLARLVEITGADEIMALTNTFDAADRASSYRRLASLFH